MALGMPFSLLMIAVLSAPAIYAPGFCESWTVHGVSNLKHQQTILHDSRLTEGLDSCELYESPVDVVLIAFAQRAALVLRSLSPDGSTAYRPTMVSGCNAKDRSPGMMRQLTLHCPEHFETRLTAFYNAHHNGTPHFLTMDRSTNELGVVWSPSVRRFISGVRKGELECLQALFKISNLRQVRGVSLVYVTSFIGNVSVQVRATNPNGIQLLQKRASDLFTRKPFTADRRNELHHVCSTELSFHQVTQTTRLFPFALVPADKAYWKKSGRTDFYCPHKKFSSITCRAVCGGRSQHCPARLIKHYLLDTSPRAESN